MWQALKHWLIGKPPVTMEHKVFGHMLFMAGEHYGPEGYWEAEVPYENKDGVLTVLINAPDALFQRCWPIFEPDFEQWTGKPFSGATGSGNWRDDFELLSIEIPAEGDDSNEWSVGYFVEAANHYFTARFVNGQPTFNEIDG